MMKTAAFKKKLMMQVARFEARSLRERVILGAAACLVTWFVMDMLVIGPMQRRTSLMQVVLEGQREDMRSVSAELEAVRQGKFVDGDPAKQDRLAQIESEISQIDSSLRASHEHMVPPERIGALLRDLLRADERLRLVAMDTLPASSLIAEPETEEQSPEAAADAPSDTSTEADNEAKQAPPMPPIFRHGVVLTVQGDYLDVMNWLARVERLDWRMYWGSFTMTAAPSSKPVFRVAMYTLSFDKAWLKL